MEPGLDLKSSIRPGLDILATKLLSRSKSVRAANKSKSMRRVWCGATGTSLLDYELARVERVHAVGRYTYITGVFHRRQRCHPVIERAVPPSPIQAMASNVGPRVASITATG